MSMAPERCYTCGHPVDSHKGRDCSAFEQGEKCTCPGLTRSLMEVAPKPEPRRVDWTDLMPAKPKCTRCGHVEGAHSEDGGCIDHKAPGERCRCPDFVGDVEQVDVPGHEQWAMPMEKARELAVYLRRYVEGSVLPSSIVRELLEHLPDEKCDRIARIRDGNGDWADFPCKAGRMGHDGPHTWEIYG